MNEEQNEIEKSYQSGFNKKFFIIISVLIILGIITGFLVSTYYLNDANDSIKEWNDSMDAWYEKWSNWSWDNNSGGNYSGGKNPWSNYTWNNNLTNNESGNTSHSNLYSYNSSFYDPYWSVAPAVISIYLLFNSLSKKYIMIPPFLPCILLMH